MSPLHAFGARTAGVLDPGGDRPRLLNLAQGLAPAEEPVTLAEAKEWLRVDGTDQDGVITSLLLSARFWAQNYMRRSIIDQDLTARFANFPRQGVDFYLPRPPVGAVSSIEYVDSAGADQVYDVLDMDVEGTTELMRGQPDAAEEWPQGVFSVEVAYNAGVPGAAFVAEDIKTAIKIAVTQNFEFRGDQIAGSQFSTQQLKSSTVLLDNYRVFLT